MEVLELQDRFMPAGNVGARLGESPFWDHGDSVWWVDIDGRKLLRTFLPERRTICWSTPEIPGFVVLAGPDRPFVGMESGIFSFFPEKGEFHLTIAWQVRGQRFNDATIDPQGQLWVSVMDLRAAAGKASILAVMPDLALRTVAGGLTIPNGLAADDEGGRLFFSDSHVQTREILSAPCRFGTGMIGTPQIFATTRQLRGRPDGAAFHARTGRYWIAGVDGGELYGFSRNGRLEKIVRVPFPAPTKLAFLPDGAAITAKAEGGYDGRLSLMIDAPQDLYGPGLPFWRDAPTSGTCHD